MATIYVFPGQGSQKVGMGAELFDSFTDLIKKADAILGYSLKSICLEDSQNQLNSTQYTQPVLYCVNAMSYLKKLEDSPQKPSFVAGHSLGEYNALFAAGAFDFETGLKLVKRRGELMGQVQGGGMAAVVGLPPQKIRSILDENGFSDIDMANFNSPLQTVISGPKAQIEKAKDPFEKSGVKLYVPLAVSGAFHSRYMAPVQKEFSEFLGNFTFNSLSIPVIANVDALPYSDNRIRENLANQLTKSVLWTDTIRYLSAKPDAQFEEIGPGKVLSGLIRKIKAETEVSVN